MINYREYIRDFRSVLVVKVYEKNVKELGSFKGCQGRTAQVYEGITIQHKNGIFCGNWRKTFAKSFIKSFLMGIIKITVAAKFIVASP